MTLLKKLNQSAWFVPTLIVLFTALLVWFIGPYIGFAESYPFASVNNRLVAIGFVVLICLIVKFYQYTQKSKLQKEMMSALTADNGVEEAINAESKELKDKFEHALGLLKDKQGQSNALLDIPWYMMIGSPGSGKTTLLSNSGLEFPLFEHFSNQALQGIGGTKNCDWWITQEAVLLDTAGRYTSRDSHQKADESGWQNFLSLIKKYRKKPISGVLVSLSMQDLLTQNDFELGQQLIQLKQRVSELNTFFGTRFPVYVVITKSDMLAGFSQFYENFSHHEREQTFGFTFEEAQSKAGEVTSLFNQQFDELMQSVSRRQWQRMADERDPSRKAMIYGFSDQLTSLKPTLNKIVNKLTEQENGIDNGIIRGVYFTSGTQSGAPIDRLINRVSQTFGLKQSSQMAWNNDKRSYFIKELLQQVVFPEADLFGVQANYLKRKQRNKKLGLIAASVASVAVLGAWGVSYQKNVGFIDANQAAIESWDVRYKNPPENSDIRYYLPALNDFSTNISTIKTQSTAMAGMGLGQSADMQDAFSASYQRLLKTALLPFIKKHIETSIEKAQSVPATYQALKAYLMLANAEKRDAEFLSNWLLSSYQDTSRFSSAEVIYLSEHTQQLIDKGIRLENLNDDLITKTRVALLSESLSDIYYQEFKLAFNAKEGSLIDLAELAGSDWRTMLSNQNQGSAVLSRLFTAEQFSQVLTTEIAKFVKLLQSESWLLGEQNDINAPVLTRQLVDIYTQDYINSWQTLINQTKVKQFDTALSAEGAIKQAATASSPLMTLVNSIAKETNLASGKFTQAVALANKASARSKKFTDNTQINAPHMRISNAFDALHQFAKAKSVEAFLGQLNAVSTPLSLSLASTRMSETPEVDLKLVKNLTSLAYQQPEPMNLWLTALADSAKRFNDEAHQIEIGKIWNDDLLPQCESLTAFKYPFAKNASSEVSSRELAKLFSTNGELVKFYQTHLKSLVDTSTRPWRWKKEVAQNYKFDPKVLPFFEKVMRVQGDLFATTTTQPKMKLALKPIYLDARVAKFKMTANDKRMSYQFGRPITTRFTWPGDSLEARSDFTFVRQDGSETSVSQTGLFSFFKLLDEAKIDVINSHKVNITFEKDGYLAKYELTGVDRVNPIQVRQLSQFKCLTAL
ncbi:type VI secretion system membrane subunit TssM [Catenovulum sp. SM1970]|uniref:type VI secretion system membrane subunit TssM n=1 Tax=Marinifaba aquimaris TaxID=2741323 RepID=UPI0015747F25|nr:type VI secretion system membrane subunit TssM [Marinifaba aquimaris]NTS75636.1 type VI secretion system membrane subunit TssM [Marinifaba aquimaris]